MKQRLLLAIVSMAVALTAALILVGCGGGGSTIPPPTTTPPPTANQQFLALLPDGQKGATNIGDAACLGCHAAGKAAHRSVTLASHTRGRDPQPPQIDLAGWQKTQHSKIGVTCEQCHGPGSKHAAAPSSSTILAVLSPQTSGATTTNQSVTDPIVCGQCHSATFSDFSNSKHSEIVDLAIEESKMTIPGLGSLGKLCLRCHSSVFRADVIDNTIDNGAGGPAYQRMAQIESNIGAMAQSDINEYADSTHHTAACADCHDPMRATGMKLDDKGRDLQLLRHTFNTSTSNYVLSGDPPTKAAATLGQLSTFDQACAACHAGGVFGGDPRDASLQSGTSRQSFHENPQYPMLMGVEGVERISDTNGNPLDQPPAQRNTAHATGIGGEWDQCVHCHMPNGSHTWTVKLDISCLPCHTADDAQARLAIQGLIQNGLAQLRTRMSNWAKANLGDPDFWEFTAHISELGKTPPSATVENAIPIEIKRARHNYYFMLKDGSWGVHNRVYTQYLLDIANRNLDHLGIARAPLGSMSAAQVKAMLNRDIQTSRRTPIGAGSI